jgi:uncharacterized protein YjiS (DUF1127 family)
MLEQVKTRFAEWRRRARWRRELAMLDDASLRDLQRDLYMSRGWALFEANRPFRMS